MEGGGGEGDSVTCHTFPQLTFLYHDAGTCVTKIYPFIYSVYLYTLQPCLVNINKRVYTVYVDTCETSTKHTDLKGGFEK